MTDKNIKVTYWVATIVFAAWLLMDGLGGIMRAQAGQDVLIHLGYPLYLLTIVGVAKLLAVVAILQTRFRIIKEWAYAGYAINCVGAIASRAFVRDGIGEIILPLVFLAIMFIPYFLWKSLESRAASGR